MLTVQQLKNLPYSGGDPFGEGIQAEDYRQEYQKHAQRFRWWKAWQVPHGATGPNGEPRESNGRVYVEQPLGENVKCLFWNTQRELIHPELGIVPAGHTAISVMPDECELVYLDRVAPTEARWRHRHYLKRGSTSTDALLHKSVFEILSVYSDGVLLDGESYKLAANGAGIEWVEDAPAEGEMVAIEYLYRPLFEFLGNQRGVVQRGTDGKFLPQRGLIRLVQPTGNESTF